MPSLENCQTCNHPVSPRAPQCPSCGEPLEVTLDNQVTTAPELHGSASSNTGKVKKPKKRLKFAKFVLVAAAVIFAADQGLDAYENWAMERLKEDDPSEYARLMEQKEEREQRAKEQRIDRLRADVARVPVSDYGENIELYSELLELDPDNAVFQQKVAHYKNLAAQAKANQAAKVAEAEALRKRKGFHCLSTYDGSHTAVKNAVKEAMREPDSFEHIETKITMVGANGMHNLVMTYRAKNGFGGYTVSTARAQIRNSDCNYHIVSYD